MNGLAIVVAALLALTVLEIGSPDGFDNITIPLAADGL